MPIEIDTTAEHEVTETRKLKCNRLNIDDLHATGADPNKPGATVVVRPYQDGETPIYASETDTLVTTDLRKACERIPQLAPSWVGVYPGIHAWWEYHQLRKADLAREVAARDAAADALDAAAIARSQAYVARPPDAAALRIANQAWKDAQATLAAAEQRVALATAALDPAIDPLPPL